MIHKQTWVLLVVFAALLGAAFYLTKNPLPSASGNATPSPTEPAKVLSGWNPGDIASITVTEGSSNPYKIVKDSSGTWKLDGSDTLDSAKVEEVSASLLGLKAQTTLDAGYDLNVLGLKEPAETLTMMNSKNQTVALRIGKLTPTESGYYARLGDNAPVIISKGGIEDLLKLMSKANLLNWTPTPSPTATPNGAITPVATNATLTPAP